jgi:hypothetical protein
MSLEIHRTTCGHQCGAVLVCSTGLAIGRVIYDTLGEFGDDLQNEFLRWVHVEHGIADVRTLQSATVQELQERFLDEREVRAA